MNASYLHRDARPMSAAERRRARRIAELQASIDHAYGVYLGYLNAQGEERVRHVAMVARFDVLMDRQQSKIRTLHARLNALRSGS